MADSCGNDKAQASGGSSRGGDKKKTVLLFACSGGANVAEVADRAARELTFAGEGSMFCLAGLGADIQGMVQTARDADVNLVIDGCPMDCARKTFDRHGITNYRQIRVTDLGIDKAKGVRATADQVERVVVKVKQSLAEQR
jgi:uncharacterized metal-binding protein